jgi:hypothetical protein
MKFLTFLLTFGLLASFQTQAQHDTTFKPSGKPIIQVFGNFDFNATKDVQKQYAFWLGRAHFGYEYQFSKQFSGKIIIDAGRPTTVGQIAVKDTAGNSLPVTNSSKDGAYYTMNLKFASIEWKPGEHFKIQAGAVLQNHYITMERFWGYRYLAETFQDRYYKMPSSDLGFIAYYKANEKFGLDVALTNGEGFRFDQDAYGDVKMAAGLDFNPVKGLQTRVFYDYLKSKDPSKPAEQQLFSVFAGYKHADKYRIGAEYNYRKNNSNIPHHDLFGYSVYGSYRIFKKMEYFARYDHLMSNGISGDAHVWNYHGDGQAIITGLHFSPVNNINFSVNYQGFFPENAGIVLQHHILLSFEYKL